MLPPTQVKFVEVVGFLDLQLSESLHSEQPLFYGCPPVNNFVMAINKFIPAQDGFEVSYCLVLFVAFTMAFDFMAVFITIYFYWSVELGGDYHWYGFAFACYDLAQFVAAPFLGYWADMRSLKEVFVVSTAVNAVGNIIYALAYKSGPWLLIVGRMVAGAGAGNLAITLAYASKVSSKSLRLSALNWLRLATSVGRFSGPLLGILFLQHWWPEGDALHVEMNAYTQPAWTTAVLAFVCCILCVCVVREPSDPDKGQRTLLMLFRDPSSKRELRDSFILISGSFFVVIGFWMWYAQLVPLGVSEFGLEENTVGKVYIGVGIGFGASALLVKRLLSILKTKLGIIVSILGLCAGVALFAQFHRSSHNSPSWMLITGSALACGFFASALTIFRAGYTNRVDENPYSITLISLLSMSSSLGRFLGPFVSSLITSFEGNSSCCNKQELVFDCCKLHGINRVIIVAVVLAVVGLGVLLWYMLHAEFDAEQEDECIDEEQALIRDPTRDAHSPSPRRYSASVNSYNNVQSSR